MKRFLIIVLTLTTLIFISMGCSSNKDKQPSDKEILESAIQVTFQQLLEYDGHKDEDDNNDEQGSAVLSVGDLVKFEAQIIPSTIARTNNVDGETKYFILVAEKDYLNIYMDNLIQKIDEFIAEYEEVIDKVKDDEVFNSFLKKYDFLIKSANYIPVDTSSALCVVLNPEAKGMVEIPWNSIKLNPSAQDKVLETISNLGIPEYIDDIDKAEEVLSGIAKANPPNLKKQLPNISQIVNPYGIGRLKEDERVDKLIDMYNNELLRRREYIISKIPTEMFVLEKQLEILKTDFNLTIVGRVLATNDINTSAGEDIIKRINGFYPKLCIEETASSFSVFKTLSGTTDYVITSSPDNAVVNLNGEKIGKTPLIIDKLEPGIEIKLKLTVPGYMDYEETIKPVSTITQIKHMDFILNAE